MSKAEQSYNSVQFLAPKGVACLHGGEGRWNWKGHLPLRLEPLPDFRSVSFAFGGAAFGFSLSESLAELLSFLSFLSLSYHQQSASSTWYMEVSKQALCPRNEDKHDMSLS